MVMLRPLLGEEYVDWEKTTDSKQNITHIWSMMVTVESREDEAIVFNNSFVVSHSQMIQMPGTNNNIKYVKLNDIHKWTGGWSTCVGYYLQLESVEKNNLI